MKKHLFAMASAVLLAPTAMALEGDKLEPVAKTPLLSGQAVASDAVAANTAVSFTDGGGKHGGNCCDPCHRCFWIYGEYINWWTKGDDTPTLLRTTSTRSGVSATHTFGNDLNDDFRQGFRIGGGFYPHCKRKNVGVEASWFSLGDHNDDTIFPGGPATIVERPFTDVPTGQPDALIIAGGPRFAGQASINHSSRFWGGNLGLRHRLSDDCGNECAGNCGGTCDGSCGASDCGNSCQACCEFQYGYQYYQLNETLNIRTSTAIDNRVSQFAAEDFDNSNQYHGVYIGLVGEYNCGKWFVGGNVRGGVGYMQEVSRIRGFTSTTVDTTTTTSPFGTLLVLPSNAGGRVEDEITWSGELGVKIGFQPTCWFRTYVGYDFLYIDQTFRPGGAVNDNVNFAQLDGFGGGVLQPAYSPRRESFWAHGFNVGMELKF